MDSDLAESLSALKTAFSERRSAARFGKAEPGVVEALRAKLRIPRRYREFLLAADPLDVETRTPAERVRLIPSSRLAEEQRGHALNDGNELLSGVAIAVMAAAGVAALAGGADVDMAELLNQAFDELRTAVDDATASS